MALHEGTDPIMARFEFPDAGAPSRAYPRAGHDTQTPAALMSTLGAGDMVFTRDARNPARDALFGSLGLAGDRVLAVRLEHTRRIMFFDGSGSAEGLAAEAEAAGGADGILCVDPRFTLSVTAADCMPIWMFDRRTGAIALLHSGWKGTGILEVAAREFRERLGTPASDLSVILGPAIGPCCYEVPETRALEFRREFGDEAAVTSVSDSGTPRYSLDLRAANLGIAERLGIGAISVSERCTACDPDLGSFRRQGPKAYARMIALCGYFIAL